MTISRPNQPQRLPSSIPRLARIKPGGLGDYQIIDELGRTVWASDWVRKAYLETRPVGIIRGQRWG